MKKEKTGERDRGPASRACRTATDLPLPSYQSAHAAGLDLLAAVPATRPGNLTPASTRWSPTGIAIALPPRL